MSAPSPSRRRFLPRAGLLFAALLGLHCDPPPVEPTADPRQKQKLSSITGEVVVLGRARGNAIVLLYEATRPPPPQGTGRPVAFSVIPRERLFGVMDNAAAGPFTAPYAFSLVAPGSYIVRGFIDADTCRTGVTTPCHGPDFIPWYTVTGEPNAGDMGGAAVDPITLAPRVLDISAAEGEPLPAYTGVNVIFSEANTLPVDRPVFYVDSPQRFERTANQKILELKPLQIDEGAVHQRPFLLPTNPPTPALLVRFVDENGDGQPDDANRDNLPDLWPRVLVRKLADGEGLADENDLDRNGILDLQGVEYARQDGTTDGQPDLVVLAAGIDPAIYESMRKPDGTWRMDPVPVLSLRVIVQAQAIDARDPRNPQNLRAVPSGRYAINLVQFTGQTWRVPNELSPQLAPELGLPGVKSQAFVIEVP